MKTIGIKQKLTEMGVDVDAIVMGDFDRIGEFTAKRERGQNDPGFKKHGAFYRSNYERGILIYHLIRQNNLTSMLEIGFGRGYGTLCAAKAFHDMGIIGKVMTVDPNFDERFINALGQVFPKEWFNCIQFAQGTSREVLPQINEKFDLVYIDGDHSYEGTKFDWENTKDKWNRFVLFDDYHMASKDDPGIKCNKLIDEIDDSTKELIIMDRRIFFDDRQTPDELINYGQVLLTAPAPVEVERADW
jgi:hypothetical protein